MREYQARVEYQLGAEYAIPCHIDYIPLLHHPQYNLSLSYFFKKKNREH
jgi:hypothetical protein